MRTCRACVCSSLRAKRVKKPRTYRTPWNKGIPISDEQKEKLNAGRDRYHVEHGAWNKGLKMSAEFRQKYCKGRPMPHSEDTKKRMADGRRQKGISRSCVRYKKWREEVLKRDNYACQVCGTDENLTCHHVVPFYENIELRFDISNGQTLCAHCHGKVDGYKKGQKGPWIGKNLPEWMKEKLRSAHKGKKLSEEHRRKISESLRKRSEAEQQLMDDLYPQRDITQYNFV